MSCTKATTSSLPSTARPTTADCTMSLCELRIADLGRVDVETRANDHFLGAADDMENIAVESREVAGVEPALAVDHLGRQIRCAIVAAHHVAATDVKLADFAARNRYTVERADAGFDTRQHCAHGLIV